MPVFMSHLTLSHIVSISDIRQSAQEYMLIVLCGLQATLVFIFGYSSVRFCIMRFEFSAAVI